MIRITGTSEKKQFDSCSGKTVSHKTEYSPDIEDASMKCSEDGISCISKVPTGVVVLPIAFNYTGTSSGNSIQGKTVINRDVSGDSHLSSLKFHMEQMADMMPPEIRSQMMEEIGKMEGEQSRQESEKKISPEEHKGETKAELTVVWNLSKRDPCSDIADQLSEDLSMIRAYADDGLFNKAKDEGWTGEEYDEAVFKLGFKINSSKWWLKGNVSIPGGGDQEKPKGKHGSGIDTGLNNETCKVMYQEENRESIEKNCYPQAIFESTLEHEKTHARQCMSEDTRQEFLSRTQESFRKFETEAYCAGANRLLAWADGNCSDSEMKPFKDAYSKHCER
jgi:hypothetical protein